MRNAGGYLIITDPEVAAPIERDTVSCGHCNRVVEVKAGTGATVYLWWSWPQQRYQEEAGAFCRCCMKPVCLRCHDLGTCTPLEKWLEQQEHAGRRHLPRA